MKHLMLEWMNPATVRINHNREWTVSHLEDNLDTFLNIMELEFEKNPILIDRKRFM